MSKKKKSRHLAGREKKNRQFSQTAQARPQAVQPKPAVSSEELTSAERAARPASSAVSRVVASTAKPLQVSYEYVVSDLRRIGITAAIMFGIMGVLTFFLR